MSLIDMFPECDINFMLDRTFKGDKIVINDVCNICNNGVLSHLDVHGAGMVKDYFVRTYEANDNLTLPYDHSTLSRWLLKILFNNARSLKIDTTWFESNLDFILGETAETALPFSVFAGISVDMTPLPEFFFDNMKLGVFFNPIIVRDSILEFVNPVENTFKRREEIEGVHFQKLMLSGILRFGSAMFLVFLWEKDIAPSDKQDIEKMMEVVYPYTFLNNKLGVATLKRVTHAYNYHNYGLIDTVTGLYIADKTNSFLPLDVNPIQKRKEDSEKWDKHVEAIRENRASRRQREREKRKKKKEKKIRDRLFN
ncbi:hypothetical protein [Peribacillus asahii]|uniref:hypothetical protein n=1 Tax=Peribacillus asahii TaxID=228899 RepID=UPI0037FFDB25